MGNTQNKNKKIDDEKLSLKEIYNVQEETKEDKKSREDIQQERKEDNKIVKNESKEESKKMEQKPKEMNKKKFTVLEKEKYQWILDKINNCGSALNFSYTKLGLDEIRIISQEIVINHRATYMDLSNCGLDNLSLEILSEAIAWNDTLNNPFRNYHLIIEAVTINCNLTNVNMDGDTIIKDIVEFNKKFPEEAKKRSDKIKEGKLIRWTPEYHPRFPLSFKQNVFAFLMCLKLLHNKTKSSIVPLFVPKFVKFEIIIFTTLSYVPLF
eukprot:TRINITY_DN6309_c0_g1_i2.p1 TRINITY_DN6309_c0_g1~~TRINITY_DN6309_c0_g1_i2.p1  ORF type:complete len:267 (+),score=57.27 TRINITY_DN6309_c0_g1_i2:54-854(+)